MDFLGQFLVASAAFVVIDLLWLGVIAKSFYQRNLARLMAPKPNWLAAGLFYSLFLVGLIYFAIGPAISEQDFADLIVKAALYGFFTYMTYELTNWAVIKDWPAKLVLPDIIWGVVLSTAVAMVTYGILA